MFWRVMCMLALLQLLVIRVTSAAVQCTWTDTPNTAGQQDQATDSDFARSLNECKTKCDNYTWCTIISFANSIWCNLYTSRPTTLSEDGTIYSVKTCQEDTTPPPTTTADTTTSPTTAPASAADTTTSPPTAPTTAAVTTSESSAAPSRLQRPSHGEQACTMQTSSNTKGNSAPNATLFRNGVTAKECSDVCAAVSECTAYSYTTDTCKLYAASTTASYSANSVYGEKIKCNDKMCCFKDSTNTSGGSNAALTVSSTLASCEALCLATSNCQAITFTDGSCNLYKTSPATTNATGSTHSVKKSCSPGMYTITEDCLQGAGAAKMSTVIPFICVFAALFQRISFWQ